MVMPILLIQLNQAAIAQNQRNQESTKIEISELEKTIQLLENPEESTKLATRLRALLEAKKKLIEEKREAKKARKGAYQFI